MKIHLVCYVNACYRPYYDLNYFIYIYIYIYIYICMYIYIYACIIIIIDLTVNDSSVHKLLLSLKNNLELYYQ